LSAPVAEQGATRHSDDVATIYYTATSLDGVIADPQASLGWLLARDHDPDGPMGYTAFERSVGALAMGATTYRWVLEHDVDEAGRPRWQYRQPCWVFTHRDQPSPPGDVRFVQGPVEAVHAEMTAAAGDRHVWVVGGGDLAGQFAAAGLLDEVWASIAPVTLGAGAPLLPRHVELRLLEVARNRDFACLRYAVADPAG
jgi:dihydrofolate reductase